MTAHHDYITALLHDHYQACLLPGRQRRVHAAWRPWPALTEPGVEGVARIITDAHHPDHNRVAAALLDAHRHRRQPDVEMTLLLAAARPLVLVLDRRDRYADSRAGLWSAVVRRLAGFDPALIATHPTPFLVQLFGRIRADAAKQPSEPVPLDQPTDHTQLERVLTRRSDPQRDEVATRAIARTELHQLRLDRAWPDLERYALHGYASRIHPNHIARQRRRLADTLGHHAA